jgi:chemotaxis protein methyltransferase CheR
MNSVDLLPFQALVQQRSGLQVETLAESSLMVAVQKRMSATQTKSSSAYYTHLLADDAEFDELVSLLTINETYFYREPQQLELLTELFLPTLLARLGDSPPRPLRILSAGCSTGEEPYSIAIAVREKFGESAGRLVSISAGDIDQHALQRARQAYFPEYSFRATPREWRERYFTHEGRRGYRLDETICAMVEFHPLNLLDGDLSERLADFDVIFFRNVSIYFDAPSRERILRTLHAAMRETGYLLLGTAETLANDVGVFQLREDRRGFYFVKGDARPAPQPSLKREPRSRLAQPAKKPLPVAPARPAPAARRSPQAPPPIVSAEQIDAVRAQIRARRYGAALEQLAPLRQADPDHLDAQLLESYALLQSRRFAEATALARQLLEADHWSVDAMVLLGFAAKWQGDNAAAIEHFRSAAYTRPDCWPAHYHLGSLLYATQPVKAQREYRTALLQISAHPDPDGGLRLPLDLPVEDIRYLCERRSVRESPGIAPEVRCGA